MVTDLQVRRLFAMKNKYEHQYQAADSLYTPVYTKLAETAYSGCQQSATNDTGNNSQIQGLMSDEGFAKSLEMSHLGTKKKPLSSSDNSGLRSEAEGTRTLNLRIDRMFEPIFRHFISPYMQRRYER